MAEKTGIAPVFIRECKRIATSKIFIWGFIIAPILSMLVLVYMMDEGLPRKIPIAVVDLDNSATSRKLVRQLDAFPKTDIKFKSLNFREARQQMEQMKVYAILTIPQNFSTDAASGKQPKLVYYTNNAFLISGSLLFQDLKTISTLASASVGLQTGQAKGYTVSQIMPIVQPISVSSNPIGNPWLNYGVYLLSLLLPAILQLLIFMFTVSSFGSELKEGSGRYLLDLSGNSIVKTIIGKMLPYTIVASIIGLLFMSVLYYYLRFPLHCGFCPMFANYVCLIIASQGFGIILMAIFRNYRFALSIASLLGMVTFSIMGMSFPVLAMSGALQSLANIFPMRHFMLIYNDLALNGYPIGYATYHYAALLAFGLTSVLFWGTIRNLLYKNKYEE